jgi:regulator of PEP synthase PpsR (kinase-PPPase family)
MDDSHSLISRTVLQVFCLTLQPDYLVDFRRNRFQREMSRNTKRSGYGSLGLGLGGGSSNSIGSASSCSYADSSYVQRDLDNARSLARTHGYTEIDVTGRAMEETSSLILSKLQERFPDQACYHGI